MATGRVLSIPRSDEDGSAVLIRVSAAKSAAQPLSLKLVATEGSAPYVFSLQQSRINKLKLKNNHCSTEEWGQILEFVLLGQGAALEVETSATVQDGTSITISFLKRVQTITQRLGSISLAFKEDETVELFDWCVLAAESRTHMQIELATATAKAKELEQAVDGLKIQLDDFIKAKQDDEALWLEKFCAILNEKKVKIREQQRIIDDVAANRKNGPDEPAKTSQSKPQTRGARASKGKGKRKAAVVDLEEEDSDDGFERMDIDPKQETAANDEERETTDDDATGSEPEEVKEAEPVEDTASGAVKGKAPPSRTDPKPAPEVGPPPSRSLPFGQRQPAAGKKSAVIPAVPANGSETESDDEL